MGHGGNDGMGTVVVVMVLFYLFIFLHLKLAAFILPELRRNKARGSSCRVLAWTIESISQGLLEIPSHTKTRNEG